MDTFCTLVLAGLPFPYLLLCTSPLSDMFASLLSAPDPAIEVAIVIVIAKTLIPPSRVFCRGGVG